VPYRGLIIALATILALYVGTYLVLRAAGLFALSYFDAFGVELGIPVIYTESGEALYSAFRPCTALEEAWRR
jgi:hypothetical protein